MDRNPLDCFAKIVAVLIGFLFIFLFPHAFAATSVSQYGITWTFGGDFQTGQFANGDYWVIGPVTITSITPAFNGINNGWQVNPLSSTMQGFDAGAYHNGNQNSFDAGLVPGLPYTAQPGESIVKTISKFQGSSADCYACCLQTAAVLTVVSSPPPGNGTNVFRPPYTGNAKPYYDVSSIRTELLPSLAPVGDPPSLDWVKTRFERVQLDHGQRRMGRIIRPEDNMENYQPDNSRDINEAVLRLMLNNSTAETMPALIAFLQGGIDQYHAVLNGQTWPAGGGYEPGHKFYIATTGTLLNHAGMKNVASTSTFFNEDRGVYRSGVTGVVLYGFEPPGGSERTRKDPNECIDGGNTPGESYQLCCLSMPWKSEVLASILMSALGDVFSSDPQWGELIEYVDRWVSHGALTLPDCVTPARHPERDGLNRDNGLRYTSFQGAMWNAYRHLTPVCGDGMCHGTEICSSCPQDCGLCNDVTPPSSPTNLIIQ